jgi:hypothetical protein
MTLAEFRARRQRRESWLVLGAMVGGSGFLGLLVGVLYGLSRFA